MFLSTRLFSYLRVVKCNFEKTFWNTVRVSFWFTVSFTVRDILLERTPVKVSNVDICIRIGLFDQVIRHTVRSWFKINPIRSVRGDVVFGFISKHEYRICLCCTSETPYPVKKKWWKRVWNERADIFSYNSVRKRCATTGNDVRIFPFEYVHSITSLDRCYALTTVLTYILVPNNFIRCDWMINHFARCQFLKFMAFRIYVWIASLVYPSDFWKYDLSNCPLDDIVFKSTRRTYGSGCWTPFRSFDVFTRKL